MPYKLIYSATSHQQIRHLHPDLKSIVRIRLKSLLDNPCLGRRLERELSGYFSLRSSRYRILYKVRETDKIIEIHYAGHRRDIYELFRERLEDVRKKS